MKIALVFFGQARDVKESFKSIKENLIDGNDVDIFAHTWNSNEVLDVLSTYNCKAISIETQKDFNVFYNNKTLFCPKSLNIVSMFYSQQKGCELVKESGIEYDFVVRLRFDMYLRHKIDFSKLNKNCIYVSEAAWAGSHLVDDCWMVSDNSLYNMVYSTICNDLITHTTNFVDRAEGCKYNHYKRLGLLDFVKRERMLDFALNRDKGIFYNY